MTRPFTTEIDGREYDCIMALGYEGDGEWYVEIESPGKLPDAHRAEIIDRFRNEQDWAQLEIDYLNDIDESRACDRWHSEREGA